MLSSLLYYTGLEIIDVGERGLNYDVERAPCHEKRSSFSDVHKYPKSPKEEVYRLLNGQLKHVGYFQDGLLSVTKLFFSLAALNPFLEQIVQLREYDKQKITLGFKFTKDFVDLTILSPWRKQ